MPISLGSVGNSQLADGFLAYGLNRPRSLIHPEDFHLIYPLDALTDAAPGNSGVESLDSTYRFCSADPTGTWGNYKLTAGANTNPYTTMTTFSTPIDISLSSCVLTFYIHAGTDGQTDYWLDYMDRFDFEIRSGAGQKYSYFKLWEGLGANRWGHEGLNEISFCPCKPTSAATDGEADLTAVDSLRFYLPQASSGRSAVTLVRVGFFRPSYPTGIYTLFLDATSNLVPAAAAYAASKGIKLGIGINPYIVGTASQMTWTQVRELQYLGHDIHVYTSGPDTSNWDDKTDRQKKDIFKDAMHRFTSNGINPAGASIGQASGGNGFSLTDDMEIKPIYMSTFMGENPADNSPRRLSTLYDPSKLDWSASTHANKPSVPTDFAEDIADAETFRALMNVGGHMAVADDLTAFVACADLLDASTLTNRTQRQLLGGQPLIRLPAGGSIEAFLPGTWGIDTDGAGTNGGGIVGTVARGSITLTNAAAAMCKVYDLSATTFYNLAATAAGDHVQWKMFPSNHQAGDMILFGASAPFCELALDIDTVATFNSTDVIEWFYATGAKTAGVPTGSALTLVQDKTDTTDGTGGQSFQQDGAIHFVPPDDWAKTVVDSQDAYWIWAKIATGKAANLTQTPTTNSVEHNIVTPTDGIDIPYDCYVRDVRGVTEAATLPTATDVIFHLVNFTTGNVSEALTWAQDTECETWSDISGDGPFDRLYCRKGDKLGVLVVQEDGTNELSDVHLTLTLIPR